MARPIWNGTLSFGLLNVPVALMPGERRADLHFRMLDSRDNAPIRYERVNSDTGEEVPWKEIVKAFEYSKGNYVVLEPDDIRDAAPESKESVDVETFVDVSAIGPAYFEKPYVLVPGKKAEKGYVLLRETLSETGKIGIGRVVIRTREYLCAVMPQGAALLLILLRYPQELIDVDEYRIPEGKPSDYRISKQEMTMASQLIASMAAEWTPGDYRDEFRQRLSDVIKKRMKANKITSREDEEEDDTSVPENAATNVVDFMSLLKESLATNKRTPPKAGSKPKKSAETKADSGAAASKVTKKPPAKKKSKTATVKKKAASSKAASKVSTSRSAKSGKSATKTSAAAGKKKAAKSSTTTSRKTTAGRRKAA